MMADVLDTKMSFKSLSVAFMTLRASPNADAATSSRSTSSMAAAWLVTR